MCSLGIEATTFALLAQYSTTEPQEHSLGFGAISIAHASGQPVDNLSMSKNVFLMLEEVFLVFSRAEPLCGR